MSLSFATRRKIVTTFWQLHDKYDQWLTWFFEGVLRYKPRRHGFPWLIATFNLTSCYTCFAWRMWGIGFVAGAAAMWLLVH